MLKSVEVTRESLYAQAWETPMRKLAAGYGVSDVALAKTCRRLAVPLPPRGYWAKVQAGKKAPPRPPLPAAKDGPVRATVSPSAPRRPSPDDCPIMEACARSLSVEGASPVTVPDRLHRPHPAVRTPSARTAPGRAYSSKPPETLPVSVSKASMDRALRIMDALAKALEQRGYPVTGAGACIEGTTVPISIAEKDDRAPHVATAKELAGKAKRPWEKIPAWDYAPSGELTIHSDCWPSYADGLRRRWSDTRKSRLEDTVADVLLGLVAIGAANRREADERQAEQERRAEQERQRLERERQARMAAGRTKDVVDGARALAEADAVRRLVASVKERAEREGAPPGLNAWLERATAAADALDPTSPGLEALLARHEQAAELAGRPPERTYGWT